MALPVSPNSISMAQVNAELAQTVGRIISFDDALVRSLFAKTTANSVIALSDGWGKSKIVKIATPVVVVTTGAQTVRFDWDAVAGARYWIYLNGSGTAVEVLTNYKEITGLGNNVSQTIRVYITKTGDTTSSTSAIVTGTSWSQLAITSLTSVSSVGSLTFLWTVDPNVSYLGAIDGGYMSSVVSPTIYSGLSSTSHTFNLSASRANYITGNASLSASPSAVTTLSLGATATSGTILATDQALWYTFTATYAATHRVAMNKTGTSNIDAFLYINGPNSMSSLTYDDDSGGSRNALATFTTIAGGVYYIQARSLTNIGAFSISVARTGQITLATPVVTGVGGAGSVSFSWPSVAEATSYVVWLDNGPQTTIYSTSFSSTVAAGGHTLYVIAVNMVDHNSESGAGTATATIAAIYPGTPSMSFSSVYATTYRATATATNAVDYYIYSYDVGGYTHSASGIVDYSGRTPSTTYSHFALAYSSTGHQSQSGAYSVTTIAARSAPGNVSITSNAAGTYFSLSWAAATGDLSSYILYKLNTYTGGYESVEQYPYYITSAVTTASPGITSTYYLGAIFSDGQIWWYPQFSGTGIVPVVRTAPGTPSASAITSTSVNLWWTAATGSDLQYYRLYQSTGGSYYVISYQTSTSFTVPNLSPSTTTYYYVDAYFADGTVLSTYSGMYVTTAAVPVVVLRTAPGIPWATAPATATSVNLQWTAATGSDLSHYLLYQSSGSGYSVIASQTSTSFTVTNLSPSTSYSFIVDAYFTGGVYLESSSPLNLQTAAAATVARTAPGTPYVTVTTSASINLAWTAATGSGFNYHRLYQWNGSTWVNIMNSASTSFTVSGLQPSATYYFYVDGYFTDGASMNNGIVLTTQTAAAGFSPISITQSVDGANFLSYTFTSPITRTTTFAATGTDVKLSVDSGATWQDVDNLAGRGESMSFVTPGGTPYGIRVKPFDLSAAATQVTLSIT